MNGLKVGELAKRAGVNPQTIHYYERRGLLREPPRTASNYRAYPDDAVVRVRFIKHAQELGFSLEDIKELLTLRAEPGARCSDVLEKVQAKNREIEAKIASLERMRAALAGLMDECRGTLPISECPILESLVDRDV